MPPHKLRIRQISKLQSHDREGAVTVRPLLRPVVRAHNRAREPPKLLLKPPPTNSGVVRSSQYHCDNNEMAELSVLGHKGGRSLCSCGSRDEKVLKLPLNELFNDTVHRSFP